MDRLRVDCLPAVGVKHLRMVNRLISVDLIHSFKANVSKHIEY